MTRHLPAWYGIFVGTVGGIGIAVALVRALGWTLVTLGTVLLAESMLVIPLVALIAFARPRTARGRTRTAEQPGALADLKR
ncbi:MAG: hypothetical protein HOV71_24010 [Hamadaea sp.]|uniref:hypothetical protein n=1 Tax=Hamadaea sp. NPDC050747 TaxID=3155789 RepID=UPI0018205CA6|nr:hypothetical protein [Hamadaea sp.]NUR51202.1 hypothetical protein [Hamadaea sp.]NUT06607.1 hypothetical protein [Hamadaea sp.]